MKASFIPVLLLVAFTCGENKKRVRRRLQEGNVEKPTEFPVYQLQLITKSLRFLDNLDNCRQGGHLLPKNSRQGDLLPKKTNDEWLRYMGTLRFMPKTGRPKEYYSEGMLFNHLEVSFQKGRNWGDITTEEKFYEMFPNIPRLPQHRKGDNEVLKPRKGKGHNRTPLGNRGPKEPEPNNAGQPDTSTNCASRRTLIGLPIKQYFGQHIFPSCAWVNRCTGCLCPSPSLTCKPGKETKKTVYFYRFDGSTLKQDKTEIKEHVTCSCQCIKLPSSCNATTQNWDSGQCDCNCKPEYQSRNMNCQRPFTYSHRTCGCVCPKAQEDCPPEMRWSIADCRCVAMPYHFLNTKGRLPVLKRLPISEDHL